MPFLPHPSRFSGWEGSHKYVCPVDWGGAHVWVQPCLAGSSIGRPSPPLVVLMGCDGGGGGGGGDSGGGWGGNGGGRGDGQSVQSPQPPSPNPVPTYYYSFQKTNQSPNSCTTVTREAALNEQKWRTDHIRQADRYLYLYALTKK